MRTPVYVERRNAHAMHQPVTWIGNAAADGEEMVLEDIALGFYVS